MSTALVRWQDRPQAWAYDDGLGSWRELWDDVFERACGGQFTQTERHSLTVTLSRFLITVRVDHVVLVKKQPAKGSMPGAFEVMVTMVFDLMWECLERTLPGTNHERFARAMA